MIFGQCLLKCISVAESFLKNCGQFVRENDFGDVIVATILTMFSVYVYFVVKYCVVCYKKLQTILTVQITDKDFIYNVDECPICLTEFTTPVRVDCGHVYCLSCLVTYFQTNNLRFCTCPLCKTLVLNASILHNYAETELPPKEKNRYEKDLKRLIKRQRYQPLFLIHLLHSIFTNYYIVATGTVVFTGYLYGLIMHSNDNVTPQIVEQENSVIVI